MKVAMINRNYPISSHYFPKLIEDEAIYVDKTPFIVPLLQKKGNATFFLSRPRRFGKSLFMSAIEHVLRGRQELFKGLYIYDKIKWEAFPVIRLSLDRVGFSEIGLEKALYLEINNIAKTYEIELEKPSYDTCFAELIQKMNQKYQKGVVVLIDEYDKPIIRYLEVNDMEQAEINRHILKSFYGILKDSDQFLRFTFITGVSKFSKVSIFSDLNHFDDLTLDPKFMTVCGFTEAEIRHYCGQGLLDLAAKNDSTLEAIVDKMRFWYNGFSWNAKDFVYNPFSTMLLMKKQEFKNYWFETGTPSFLIPLINKALKYDFSNLEVDSDIYNWHDLKRLDYLSIMLQTGYLTFKQHIDENIYKIDYPNKEVEDAFSKMLLEGYTYTQQGRVAVTILDIERAFKRNDVKAVIDILADMFKTLPLQFFAEDVETLDKLGNIKIIKKAVNENFYHAIIYLVFNILGIKMPVEVSTNQGRIDAVVETETHIYIFEFKKNRKPAVAIQQMKDKNYAEHYGLSKKQIVLVGVCFTMQKRGISGHLIEAI
jgi:Predicted AAA-ATPase/PD-(D/E)XK nuclease superfamily